MNPGIESGVVQMVAKLTIVLAGAWLAHAVLWSANPRWRVWLWRVTAVGLAGLSIAACLPPLYSLPVLHRAADAGIVARPRAMLQSDPADSANPNEESSVPAVPTSESPVAVRDAPHLQPSPAITSEPVPVPTMPTAAGVATSSPPASGASEDRSAYAASARRLGWWSCLLAVYGVVASFLVLRLSIGWVLAGRELRRSKSPPGWVQAIARQSAERMGGARMRVRVTDRFRSPVLIGVWRPTVLVPSEMLDAGSAENDLRGVVAHEAAHAWGHDAFWDRVMAVMLALLWPHPLVWRIRAAHRAACERVCDRVATDLVGDLASYQSLLARLALRVSGHASSLGLTMTRRADIRGRLAALVRCPRATRLPRRATAMALGITAAIMLLGAGAVVQRPAEVLAAAAAVPEAEPDANPGDPPKAQNDVPDRKPRSRPETLRFTVVRRDNGQPVEDAQVTVRMYGGKQRINRELKTDAHGIATFEYPDGDRSVSLWATVRRARLVPYYVNFGRQVTPAALPTEKTIRLEPGKKIGGKVVDPEGNPVTGAQLSITAPAVDSPTDIHYHLLYKKTEADGSWVFDGAPLDVAGLRVKIEHPRFITSWQPLQDRADGRYQLDPGVHLKGRVTDRDGNPVPEAHITVGRDRWGSLDTPVPVNDDGRYVVYALRAESTWVTAEAPGFAPQVKPAELDEDTEPVDFQLEPGHTVRIKVIDPDGKPVKGIRVVADTWNGFRSLWWEATTDEQGLVTWNGAPKDAVEYHVVGAGFAAVRDANLAAGDDVHIVRVPRRLRVRGVVADPKGKAIREFHVAVGRKLSGRDGITWMSHEGTAGRNGVFELTYDEAGGEIYVRIEAAGYQPWTSGPIAFAQSRKELEVVLEAGSGSSGVVRAPDGRPAPGARLTMVTGSQGMQFVSGYRPIGGKQTVLSDPDGRFEFLPVDEPALIVAVHETGYAEKTVEEVAEAGGIKLEAWARLEVTLRRGDRPLGGARIEVQPGWPQPRREVNVFSYAIGGVTGAAGVVTFDRVVPRDVHVRQSLEQPIGRGTTVYAERSRRVSLRPGGFARVELGGSGQTIVGRLAVPGDPPARHSWRLNEAVDISTRSDESHADARRHFRCLIDKDGSFRAEDIPPGSYDLRVNLTAAPNPDQCGHGGNIGRIVKRIEVTEAEPLIDLGVIQGEWFKQLGVKDPAPLFVVRGVDGGAVRLGEYRGRLLLIDFWATWCGPCMAEMPELVKLREEFAGDARFEILGLSLDRTIKEASAAADRHGWPWLSAFAGPGTSAMVPRRYDVKAIPEKFLIDVDGTILYRGNDVARIRTLVRDRLKKLPVERSPAARYAGVEPIPFEDDFPAGEPVAVGMATYNIHYDSATREPSLAGPGMWLWSADGRPIRQIEGLGTSAWLTGPKRFAVDATRERLYTCDTARDRLVALDRLGRQLFATEIEELHAVAVDERTGDIWCLSSSYLNSGELLVLDVEGREKTRFPIGAFALAYSPVDDAFWIAGRSIMKVNRQGEILSSVPLPEGAYTFTSVAVDRNGGGAWVLEDDHPDVPRSSLRLWRAASDGTALVKHQFPKNTFLRSLACVNGRPWVVVGVRQAENEESRFHWQVRQYNADGTLSNTLAVPARGITVGQRSHSIWILTEDRLLRVGEDGKVLQSIALDSGIQGGQIAAF